MGRNSIVPNSGYGRGRKWIIRLDGDQYQVGSYSRRDKTFNAVCRCDHYDQAELICETLKGYIPGMTRSDDCKGGGISQ